MKDYSVKRLSHKRPSLTPFRVHTSSIGLDPLRSCRTTSDSSNPEMSTLLQDSFLPSLDSRQSQRFLFTGESVERDLSEDSETYGECLHKKITKRYHTLTDPKLT